MCIEAAEDNVHQLRLTEAILELTIDVILAD